MHSEWPYLTLNVMILISRWLMTDAKRKICKEYLSDSKWRCILWAALACLTLMEWLFRESSVSQGHRHGRAFSVERRVICVFFSGEPSCLRSGLLLPWPCRGWLSHLLCHASGVALVTVRTLIYRTSDWSHFTVTKILHRSSLLSLSLFTLLKE